MPPFAKVKDTNLFLWQVNVIVVEDMIVRKKMVDVLSGFIFG